MIVFLCLVCHKVYDFDEDSFPALRREFYGYCRPIGHDFHDLQNVKTGHVFRVSTCGLEPYLNRGGYRLLVSDSKEINVANQPETNLDQLELFTKGGKPCVSKGLTVK